MSFIINTLAIDDQKGNDVFIANPSSTGKYEFVRRLNAAVREGEMIGKVEGRRLYGLAEVKDRSTGMMKVVAIPFKFIP